MSIPKKLNLGSGEDYRVGWINLDLGNKNQHGKNIKTDIDHDLNKFPYPFKDDTFDEILLNQVLEHLDNPSRVIEELVRIAKNNAIITIRIPHFSDVGAYEEPSHKHFFALNSIDFMNYGCKVKKNLELHRNLFLWAIGKIFTLSPFFYEHYLKGFFPIKGIKWVLRVNKNKNLKKEK